MKPSSFLEYTKAPVLALATTLAACGGAPVQGARPDTTQLPQASKIEAPTQDPAMLNAIRAMREVKAKITAAAHTKDAAVGIRSLRTPDGLVYTPKPGTYGDQAYDYVDIYDANARELQAQVALYSEPNHRFEITEPNGVAVDCAGPEEEQEWRTNANVPGLRPEDWVCQTSLLTLQGIQTNLFPLSPEDAASFLEIRPDVESITAMVENELRIQIERGGSVPVQGQ